MTFLEGAEINASDELSYCSYSMFQHQQSLLIHSQLKNILKELEIKLAHAKNRQK